MLAATPPGQRERRQQRMTHPAPAAPQPRHPDPPAPAARTDEPPVTRPEHHPRPARRAIRTRDLHVPAQLRIHLDRQRARPYHDHRRSPPQIPPHTRRPNQARGDLSHATGNSKILSRDRRRRQRDRQRARPDTRSRWSSNKAVNTPASPDDKQHIPGKLATADAYRWLLLSEESRHAIDAALRAWPAGGESQQP